MPSCARRVANTARVWGWQSASTTTRSDSAELRRRISVTASATAVPSSRSDAFAVSSPVRSATMVWKFNKASSLPWLISGWYGVYAVYQAGLSRMLRRMTPGVTVPE